MMKLTPNENVLRVALIVFSILFGILSISLIALGIVYADELWWPKRYVDLEFIQLPTLLIVLGSLSFVMAVAGCFCAKTYSRILLLLFAAILLVILCLELSVAVIAFINFDEHEGDHTKTHNLMLEQYQNGDAETRLFLQEIEDHYACCGVNGNETDCTESDYDYADMYEEGYSLAPMEGCAQAVNDHVQMVAAQIGYFASILAVLQVIEVGYVFLIQQSVKEYYA